MAPRVTVLQLDTDFPRVPGDVACEQTYLGGAEIMRIPGATVGQIVSHRPDLIDISPFEDAVRRATGEVIVTSCGFLSYWQDHLSGLISRPFISSALTALDGLAGTCAPGEVMILTFDADQLTPAHLGRHAAHFSEVVGLPDAMHLRDVISTNKPTLDTARVTRELAGFAAQARRERHRHLLLECTNLPPYKAALHQATQLPVTDILTLIEDALPGTVDPDFLNDGGM